MRNKLGKFLAGGLAAIASILPSCNMPISDEKPKISAYASSTLKSEYVSGAGSRLSKGPVVQNYAEVGFENVFQTKDKISAWYWDNHDLTAKQGPRGIKSNEIDVGLTYGFPLSKKISARFSPAIFFYPEGFFGAHPDKCLSAGLHYSDKIEADLNIDYMLPNHEAQASSRVIAKVAKSFPLGKLGKWGLSLTPSVKAAYLIDWYGAKGLGHVTPGISLGAKKGN
ncbi:MAG: hypothetical protein NT076_03145, partial [Candidatus Pacearchaeota archaeon]|nr:hypothetical protein [Candidatus Pacearchaeota archaeon]